MKTNPDDFQDVLAGRQNKPAAVKEIKEILSQSGLTVMVARRKLATGRKIYFTVSPPESVYETSDWPKNVGPVRNYSVDVIQKHFPLAGLTSGGSISWTIAEY